LTIINELKFMDFWGRMFLEHIWIHNVSVFKDFVWLFVNLNNIKRQTCMNFLIWESIFQCHMSNVLKTHYAQGFFLFLKYNVLLQISKRYFLTNNYLSHHFLSSFFWQLKWLLYCMKVKILRCFHFDTFVTNNFIFDATI
jgi:hypothetical protein